MRILGSALDAAIFGELGPCSTTKHQRPRRDELYDMRALSLSTACLLLSLTAPALAQGGPKPYPACDREPTSADISGAKGAYEAGQASFNEADYGRAILYWEDAFRRDCTASKLLLNLARAYELSNKKDHAVLALETYLERRPEAPDRPSIEKRIENLRAQVAAESKPAETPPEPAPAPEPEEAEPPKPAEPEPVSELHRPIWPVIMTISGAVVAGVGVGFTLDAASTLANVACTETGDVRECDANPPITMTPDQEAERANNALTQRTVGVITAAVGTGFLVAGASAWYFSWKDRRAKKPVATRVLPVLAPGYAGLTVRGRF